MKFFAIFAIFAILIATVYCADGDLDPRCPDDESTESQTTYIAHETDCTKYYMVCVFNLILSSDVHINENV